MFTGLVESLGKVTSCDMAPSGITQLVVVPNTEVVCDYGDSIAVNGCCLTVTHFADGLTFDVSRETLARTNLGLLQAGDLVNLERAVLPTTRLGGHFVSGHVDATAKLVLSQHGSDGWLMKVEIPNHLRHYCVQKGSICLDGVSLTLNEVQDQGHACTVSLMLLPTTLAKTTLGSRHEGWLFNVEVDLLAKLVERLGSRLPDATTI